MDSSEDDADFDSCTLKGDLRKLLGPEGYLLLLEHYAGTRLYVPKMSIANTNQLVDDITIDHALKLSEAYGGEYIKVPCDRDYRAIAYKRKGFSTRKIVRSLGMTECGLRGLYNRLEQEGTVFDPPLPRRSRTAGR